MDCEVVPKNADVSAQGLLMEQLDVIEELGHVDGLLVHFPSHNSTLIGDSQYQCMGRLVDRVQVHFHVAVLPRVLDQLQRLSGEHALVGVEYFVPLLMGPFHFPT